MNFLSCSFPEGARERQWLCEGLALSRARGAKMEKAILSQTDLRV